jgi:TP901 family phage tail tape measure protein
MAAITLDIAGNTRQLDRDIQKTVNQVYTINLKTKGDQPLGRITGKVNEFNKSLDASNARVIAFGASAGIIFGVERAFTALVASTIEVQKSLQDINVILNVSQKQLQTFGAGLFDIAKNTGQSFQEVAKAATEFSRQGLGVQETLKRTNEALILSRLSGLDTAKSVEALTAAVNSFANQAVTATEIVNKFATVDAAFAVSSADLADAISRVGSSAAQSGVSLNELIAIVTSAQQTTARGGAVIGNSFKTIFTRLQREKVVDLLGSLGISSTDSSGQLKSTIQLLTDLGRVYDTLGTQQQAYVAEQVGGVFQINILKAALADLGKEYSIYNNALNVAAGATDQAVRRNEELNKTYAAQLNALQQNAAQFAAIAGERLLGPAFDRVVGGANTVFEGLSNADTQGVGAVLGKGILDGIGQFIAGPGLALIGGVLLKLFKDLGKFATGSVQQLLGLNTAASQQKDLQQSINQILSKNPDLLKLALQGEQGLNQAATQLLGNLKQQTVELQRQAQVAQQISKAFIAQAGVRVAGGVPIVPTGRQGKAAGYIPNFAVDDFAREELLATALGAKNPTAQISKGTIDGKKFIKNNREVEITNFGKNGDSAVIPSYAKGFVPNFQKSTQTPKEVVVTGAKKYGYLIPSTAAGRLSTPDKPISGGVVSDTASNIRYIFPPQMAYGPKLIGEAETSNKLENQIYQSVLNRTASYTKKLAPPGKQVSAGDLEKGFSSAKGAKGAILSAIGAAFEVGITTALGYEAAKSNTGAGDFDVRAGTGIEKVQSLFGIGNILKADFKATTGKDSVESFRKKILREEYGFGGAKKRTGPTGKELRELGLTKGFKGKASGFIPNFAEIQDAISRERDAGIPKNQIYLAQEDALKNVNPMGLGVFNKQDEPTKQSRQQAIRRRGFATGYIPNFAETPESGAASIGTAATAIAAQLSTLAFTFAFSKNEVKEAMTDLAKSTKAAASVQRNEVAREIKEKRKQIKAESNANRASLGEGPLTQAQQQNITKENAKAARQDTALASKRQAAAKSAQPGLGAKAKAFGGANAFGLAIAAPIVAQTLSQAIPQETKGGRVAAAGVGAIGNIGAAAATGAIFGPVGAAVGAAAAALLEIPNFVGELTSDFPELQKAAQKASQELTRFSDAGAQIKTAFESLNNALKDPNAAQELIGKASDEYAKALSGLSSADQERIQKAAEIGKLEDEYAKILAEKTAAVAGTENAAAAGKVADDVAKNRGNINLGLQVAKSIPGFGATVKAAEASGIVDLFKPRALEIGSEEEKINQQALTGFITRGKTGKEAVGAFEDVGGTGFVKQLQKIETGDTTALEDLLGKAIPEQEGKAGFIAAQIRTASLGASEFDAVIGNLAGGFLKGSLAAKEQVKNADKIAESTKAQAEAIKQATDAINAQINSLQQNLAIQNQFKSAFENLGDNLRNFYEDLKIEKQFTAPREALESVIGTDKTPVRRLAAQEGLATIRESQRSAVSGTGIETKQSIRETLQKPFQENLDNIIKKLGDSKTFEGQPADIIAKSDEFRTQAAKETQNLNDVMSKVEGLMGQFVSGQISSQQLLEDAKNELGNIGIGVERGTDISNDLEKSLANFQVKVIQEQVKAFQQRVKLANETKQAILQQKISQALGVFGGAKGFLQPPDPQGFIRDDLATRIKDLDKVINKTTNEDQRQKLITEKNNLQKAATLETELARTKDQGRRVALESEIETLTGDRASGRIDLRETERIRGGVEYRYGNAESVEARRANAPALGRNILQAVNSFTELSGGAFTEELQKMVDQTVAPSGGMGGRLDPTSGGFGDIVMGIEESIKQSLKEFETAAQETDDPLVKKLYEGFTKSIQGLGIEKIAKLQAMQATGVARQSDFKEITGAYDAAAFKQLEKTSPELAAALASEVSYDKNDPLLGEVRGQSVIQASILEYLKPIQDAILSLAKGETADIKGFQIPNAKEAQQAAIKEISKDPAQIKAEADKKAREVQNAALRQGGRSVAEIEAETIAARDRRRAEQEGIYGTQGILGPGLGLGSQAYVNGVKQDTSMRVGVYEPTVNERDITSSITSLNEIGNRNFGLRNANEIGQDVSLASYDMNVKRKGLYDGSIGEEVTKRKLAQNPLLTLTPQNMTTSGPEPATQTIQQSFTQQEATINSNTSAIASLNGGIESLTSTLANFEANIANLGQTTTQQNTQQPATTTQPQTQNAAQSTTTVPVNIVVNAQGGGDIGAAVGAAVQNAIPQIIEKVRVQALGQKVAPTVQQPVQRTARGGQR